MRPKNLCINSGKKKLSNKHNILISVVVLAIFLTCGSAQCLDENNLLAKYQTVSESEWNISIYLYSDHTAKIVHEYWKPGEPDDALTNTYTAKYAIGNNVLTLSYDNKTAYFEVIEKSSYNIFGGEGCAPGLKSLKIQNLGTLFSGEYYFWDFDKETPCK